MKSIASSDALRVLIVTDDAALATCVTERLRRDSHRFKTTVAATGARAMRLLAADDWNAIVTGARLPDIDAVQLLGWTKRSNPQVARIVLATTAEGPATVRRIPAAQDHLDARAAESIRATLERACALNRLLLDPVARRAVQFSAMPKCYADLTVASAVANDAAAAEHARALVRNDRLSCELASDLPPQADGVETLRAAVIAAHSLQPRVGGAPGHLAPDALRERAIRRVEHIVREPLDEGIRDAACAAALLLDIGLVGLLRADLAAYLRVLDHGRGKEIAVDVAERIVLGIDHGEAGAVALGGWGLPFTVLEAIAFHHRPSLVTEGERSVLAAVHLADHRVDGGEWSELDHAFLAAAGLVGA